MAHIPDGILSLPVLAVTTAAAAAGLAVGLRKLDEAEIPKTALLSAAFFVASSLAFPLGPSSVHLLLGGLIGLILGWKAFPAIFVGLLLQALLFGFGGLTTLGADLVNMAAPGVAFAALARPFIRTGRKGRAMVAAGLAAAASVMTTGALVAAEIGLSDPAFLPAARLMVLIYVPLAIIEAATTGFIVAYLMAVKPELLAVAAERASAPIGAPDAEALQ